MSYDSAATASALDEFISGSKLDGYRGEIAPKNLGKSPGYWKVDLHFDQEIPTFVGRSRIKVFADIENFLNLLNNDWGVQRQNPFAYFAPLVNVQCLSAATDTGTSVVNVGTLPENNPNNLPAVLNTSSTQTCAQYRYSSFAEPDIRVQNQAKQSLYQIRVGVRFEF